MTSDKKNISLLRSIFLKKGLKDIVISPGSRNAPIIITFASHPDINALSIVDERSAAFFALGMSQQRNRAVAIACTSGSATLNYAPAIAEAYYQKIALLVLTSDRPPYFVDVGDGQTIRQNNVYSNYIKKSFELPLELNTNDEVEKAGKLINEAIDLCSYPEPGPVHINIPFDEPLYQTTEDEIIGKSFSTISILMECSKKEKQYFAQLWNEKKKIMILAGQQKPSLALNKILLKLAKMKQVVVLTETTSNLYGKDFIDCIDNVVVGISGKEKDFCPELLITFGDAVVSKMIKRFLRNHKAVEHWHISPSGEKRNTYFSLSKVCAMLPSDFFAETLPVLHSAESDYARLWHNKKAEVMKKHREYLQALPYSDLKVFDILFKNIPRNSVLHLGNSTPVRYSELFGSLPQFTYFSNRGVSGIDGQVSTASGAAFVSIKINTVITGDLGFFYDSNALMNNNLSPNFKIIVINNEGGGIFRFIPGPDSSKHFEKFFVATHTHTALFIAKAFDIIYFTAQNEAELLSQLPLFYAEKQRPALLEIFTPSKKNAEILRKYFKFFDTRNFFASDKKKLL